MGAAGRVSQRVMVGAAIVLALTASAPSWAQRNNNRTCMPAASGRAVVSVPNSPVGLIVGQIANGDAATVARVRDTCQRELRSGPNRAHNLEAYMCVGQATLRLAELDPSSREQNYRCAVNVYQVTADAAGRAGASASVVRGDAHARRAETLLALRGMRSPETQEAAQLLTAAINAYNESIQANPTAGRRFALGRAYISLARANDAEREIRAGQALAPTGVETAMALVSLAQLKRTQGAASQDVLRYLQDAQTAAADSTAVNAALGAAYFDMGDTVRAEDALRRAVSSSSTDDGGPNSSAARSQSFYFLSVISARTASTTSDWTRVIDYAEDAGDGEFRFRVQECIAHIARGGESVRDWRVNRRINTPGKDACDSDLDASPESQLLRGMYFMREAQSFNRISDNNAVMRATPQRDAYRAAIEQATNAFNQGLRGAQRLPENTMVSWPRHGAGNLARMLEYGASVLAYECAGAPPRTDLGSLRAEASPFFGENFRDCRVP